MKKLTRAEIQSLSDAELNHWLSSYRAEPTGKLYSIPNYCRSLDDQFELAEKFGLYIYSAYFPSTREHGVYIAPDFYMPLKSQFVRGPTKRTGAELLLEAIQELEEQK